MSSVSYFAREVTVILACTVPVIVLRESDKGRKRRWLRYISRLKLGSPRSKKRRIKTERHIIRGLFIDSSLN